MTNIIMRLGAVVMLLTSSNTLYAADNRAEAERAWQEGINAYADATNATTRENAKRYYAVAIDNFKEVIDRGYASADAYYNLGNAYFKLGEKEKFDNGELGHAILNYHRALKISPSMEDASYNLKLAVDFTNDTEGVPQGVISGVWTSLRDIFTSNTWTAISLVILALTLALLLVYLLSHRTTLRKVTFFSSIWLFILFELTTWLAISQRSSQQSHDRAVVMCNATTAVHASPENSSKIIREPSQGVTVTVTRSENDWSEIMFADGEKGWIPNKNIEFI